VLLSTLLPSPGREWVVEHRSERAMAVRILDGEPNCKTARPQSRELRTIRIGSRSQLRGIGCGGRPLSIHGEPAFFEGEVDLELPAIQSKGEGY